MEGLQGDIGLQVLHAIQALGGRMDRLEAQVGRLTAQVERLEQRMDGLELQLERLSIRMDKQEMWMQRLGSQFISTRDSLEGQMRQVSGEVRLLRGEMEQWRSEPQHGLRRLDARIDLTASAVVLLAAELRGPTKVEYSPRLESHLRDLKVH